MSTVTVTEPGPGRLLAWAEIDALCAGPVAVDRRAREHRAGRLLVALLLRTAGLPADATVATRRAGRPFLPDHPGLWLSVSHSGTLAAAALAEHPVGIDLQEPLPPSPALLRRCCAPGDADRLRALPARQRAVEFAHIWTAQESCVKATGRGFADAPWKIPVPVGARKGQWQNWTWQHLPAPTCPYPLCLAAPGPNPPSGCTDRTDDPPGRA